MAKKRYKLEKLRSASRTFALAVLISVLAPAFCSLGLFAVQTPTPAATERAGCHDSRPAKPVSPAPRQQCCSIAPAQAQPLSRFAVPAPMITAIATNDSLPQPEVVLATSVSVLAPDSSPPRQSVLRI